MPFEIFVIRRLEKSEMKVWNRFFTGWMMVCLVGQAMYIGHSVTTLYETGSGSVWAIYVQLGLLMTTMTVISATIRPVGEASDDDK